MVRSSRQYGRKPVRLNVNKFKCCRTLQGHTGKVCHLPSLHCAVGRVLLRVVRQCNSIQFSKLISISHFFNIVNKRNFAVLDTHVKFQIYALDWSYLESTWIVSASQDGRPIVWNAVSSQKSHAIRLACAWVMTTSFSPARTAVACGGLDNVCSIFHLSSLPDKDGNLPVSCTLMGHKGYLTCCHYVPNHEAHILTSSRHQTCILWEAEANKCLHTFGGDSPSGHNGDIMR